MAACQRVPARAHHMSDPLCASAASLKLNRVALCTRLLLRHSACCLLQVVLHRLPCVCAFGAAVNKNSARMCVLLLLPLLLLCWLVCTQLPADLRKLADDVTIMGMRSALAHAKNDRRPMSMLKQQKTKKKRKLNLRHMTNTHLAHLLTDAQYTSID